MTTTKKISISLIVLVIVVLGGWAIYVSLTDDPTDQVSRVITDWSMRLKSVPLAFGVLMGHWLWPVKKISISNWRYLVLGSLALLAILSDVFLPYFTVFPLIPFVAGVFAGHWLWPQKERAP